MPNNVALGQNICWRNIIHSERQKNSLIDIQRRSKEPLGESERAE